MAIWNPWHGCHRISAGCANCYVYRRDNSIGKDASIVTKTGDFDLPIQKDRQNVFKLQPDAGEVYTCMTSDFFLPDADDWRDDCWKMMRRRSDLKFIIITKRIDRFMQCIPQDWGQGYENVTIGCTCENQDRADYRIPVFLSSPIKHRMLIHEPMLGPIQIEMYLASQKIEKAVCGGESGTKARICDYDWILDVREQCIRQGVAFYFKQTGAVFRKEGKVYHIDRALQHLQAAKAGIDYFPERQMEKGWLEKDLFLRIRESPFRSRFRLRDKDRLYVQKQGIAVIRKHAEEFVRLRISPEYIPNDGKQTPMRGHPVFLAQHACACCCRDCLQKWHGIPPGRQLSDEEQGRIVDILMEWIERQMDTTSEPGLFNE